MEDELKAENVEYIEASIEKAADGSFVAIASTNSVDRHGEVVDNNGWDLKAFKKNPILLWAHDHSQLPIGTSKKTWVEGTGKSAKLMIQPIIHEVTDQAKAIKQLISDGILKTLSVGFRPLESADGVTFTKNELLEVSVVNVPANADAMMMAYKSLKSNGFEEEVIEEVGVQTELISKLIDQDKEMEKLWDVVEDSKVQIEQLKDLVKAATVNPKRETEERLSMLKVVAKATDKVLEAENKQPEVDHSLNRRRAVKAIKRATEILIVAEKEKLNG